jgi:hypothetical protein
VTAQRALSGFELFLASYFDGFPRCFAYARGTDGGSRLVEATQADGTWQMFPRDDDAVALIRDGRWQHPPHPVQWVVREPLAAPVAVRRDAASGLTALVMAPAADCFAVAMPFGSEGHRSVYFSLLGRDLRPGESAAARSRLVICRDGSDNVADAYRQYETQFGGQP